MIFGKKKPLKRTKPNKKQKVIPVNQSSKVRVEKSTVQIQNENETDIFLDEISKEKSKDKNLDYRKEGSVAK